MNEKRIFKERGNNSLARLLTSRGISLIVLIITIIVIIILSTAIILTINNNNPIDEANTARYESDIDSMQAIFTNTVAKVMAKSLGTVSVTVAQINTVTSGVNSATGEVIYTVTGAVNSENATGRIVFDKGENTDTVFYTGKQLPIYKAGDTKWYVDDEGVISLEIAGVKYGKGNTPIKAGLYDSSENLLISWENLIENNILIVNEGELITNFDDSYEVPINHSSETLNGKLVIDSGITKIGYNAFINCENLTDIIMPNSVTSIGEYAFHGCTALENIELSNSIISIGVGIFRDCYSLDSIVIPNGIISLSMDMFYACSGLKTVVLPDTVTSIESNAFTWCESLESFTIPKGVTEIASGTFQNCTNLAEISIPKDVNIISSNAFGECQKLKTINYSGTVDEWNSIDFYGSWNYWCSEITVKCTDGNIVIPRDPNYNW